MIKYKFRWKGTPHYECEAYNLNLCLLNNNASKKKVIMDSRVTKTFLQRSPLTQIYVKIKTILGITAPEIFFDIKKGDSLHVFMNKMDNFKLKNQGYFFFIHSLPPHTPYVFDSNCNIKKGFEFIDRKKTDYLKKVIENNSIHFKAYKENYECMLKRVYEFINFINKNDPDANVIITSDHGHQISDYFYLMYDTFTLVKTNEKCKKNISDNLNTPNAARLLLGCTVEQKIKMLGKKSYFVDFERGNFSIGGKLRIKKINQNNYGNIF